MKKSLLVVPALGVMLLAAAGSVGGTVAWFSATSSIDVAANTFQAIPLDGNLELTLANGKGITVTDNKTLTLEKGNRLTHASYDHVSGNLYTRSSESKGGVRMVADKSSEASAWTAKSNFDGESHNILWGVSWTMEFTYTFATEKAVYLFLDKTSSFDISTGEDSVGMGTGDAKNTIEGFRIAFVGQQYASGSVTTQNCVANTRVWANKRTAATPKYIAASALAGTVADNYYETGTGYGDNIVIGSDYTTIHKEGTPISTDVTTEPGCLGVFEKVNKTSEKSKLYFTCVAWFEGTDPSIVTANAVFNTVTANMKFIAREDTLAAHAHETTN